MLLSVEFTADIILSFYGSSRMAVNPWARQATMTATRGRNKWRIFKKCMGLGPFSKDWQINVLFCTDKSVRSGHNIWT